MEIRERLTRLTVAIVIVCGVLFALFKYASWEKKQCQDGDVREGWLIVQIFAIFCIIVLIAASVGLVYTWLKL